MVHKTKAQCNAATGPCWPKGARNKKKEGKATVQEFFGPSAKQPLRAKLFFYFFCTAQVGPITSSDFFSTRFLLVRLMNVKTVFF